MPFTFAHPAVVLPFNLAKKRWVSITGLMVGSVVPDFESFIMLKSQSKYSHTLAGMLWLDLPLAIVVCFVVHSLVKNPFINNLPAPLQRKFIRYQSFGWNRYFKRHWKNIFVCIIIGEASHLFLDSFTAQEGYFVQKINFLHKMIPYENRFMAVNSVLHYIISLLGILVLIYAIWQLPSGYKLRIRKPVSWYWIILLLLTAGLFYLGINYLADDRMKEYAYLYIGNYVVTGMSSFLLSLLIVSVLFKKRKMDYYPV